MSLWPGLGPVWHSAVVCDFFRLEQSFMQTVNDQQVTPPYLHYKPQKDLLE